MPKRWGSIDRPSRLRHWEINIFTVSGEYIKSGPVGASRSKKEAVKTARQYFEEAGAPKSEKWRLRFTETTPAGWKNPSTHDRISRENPRLHEEHPHIKHSEEQTLRARMLIIEAWNLLIAPKVRNFLGRGRINKNLMEAADLLYDSANYQAYLELEADKDPAARRRRKNPRTGAETFRMWSGRSPRKVRRTSTPEGSPGVLVELGELLEVAYRSDKWSPGKKKDYLHSFNRPRPVLATDAKGRDLYIVGGGFQIKAEGIVQ